MLLCCLGLPSVRAWNFYVEDLDYDIRGRREIEVSRIKLILSLKFDGVRNQGGLVANIQPFVLLCLSNTITYLY